MKLFDRFKEHKAIVAIFVLAILGAAVPFTLNLVKEQQQTSTKASGEQVALTLTPNNRTISTGEVFEVKVSMTSSSFNVTGVDLGFFYTNPLIQFMSFTPTTIFNTELIKSADGQGGFRYVAVNTGSAPITGTQDIGTFQFKVLGGEGVATLSFKKSLITAAGVSTPLSVGLDSGTYTIGRVTLTSTPTPTTPVGVCLSSRECPSGQSCVSGKCTPTVASPTPTVPIGGGICTTSRECLNGQTCVNGKCMTVTATSTPTPTTPSGVCTTSRECPTGQACTGGKCTPLITPTSSTCSATNPCQGGLVCVSGQCVQDACTVCRAQGKNFACNSDIAGVASCETIDQTSNAGMGISCRSCNPITSTPTPTRTPSLPPPTNTPSPTHVVNQTNLILNVTVPGITASSAPRNPKEAKVFIYNTNNQLVVTVPAKLSFYSGKFAGRTNELGANFTSGLYIIKVKLENTLVKQIPGLQNIRTNQDNVLSTVNLVSGDLNANNSLDVADYNVMLNCYNSPIQNNDNPCYIADLNDDGKVDEIDINIIQRGFAVRDGDPLEAGSTLACQVGEYCCSADDSRICGYVTWNDGNFYACPTKQSTVSSTCKIVPGGAWRTAPPVQ